MKKIFVLIGFYLSIAPIFSQQLLPNNLNYQAVVRDNLGTILPNQSVNFRFSFINTSTTTTVYQETYLATTNTFGLVNLKIGTGTSVVGTFSSINFHSMKLDLKVEIDPAGGNSFTVVGTSTLTGVPFAQYAERARTVEFNDDADANPTNELQSLTYNPATQRIYISNGNFVTLNVDESITNEIQNLSLSGNSLSISSGNSVTFPWTKGTGYLFTNDYVGIGTATPTSALHVSGLVQATSFLGNGASLSDIRADSLVGSMQADSGDVLEWDGTKWTPQAHPRLGFHAQAGAAQAISASSYALMAFPFTTGNGFDDTGGAYDTGTGTFTAPANGVYYFESQVTVNAASATGYNLNILKNSFVVRTNVQIYNPSVGGLLALHSSAVLKLNAGDTVSINVFNSGSSSVNTYAFQGRYTYFSGYRIY